jgi:hypothetical protein
MVTASIWSPPWRAVTSHASWISTLPAASHDEVDATGVGGQVHHRLSGRVPAADHDHVFARGL